MKYSFYPGCSLQKSSKSYLDSLNAIKGTLGMELKELKDWNCCGATDYQSVHQLPAHALVGRNLAIAQQMSNGSDTLMAACSACYLNLSKTDHYMAENPELNAKVNQALAAGGLHYDPGSVKVRHLLDVIYNDVGLDKIKEKVVRPLKGLRIAAYYGCMILRPDYNGYFKNPEYPTELDDITRALGAEVIDFPLKTHCCSGHMTLISPEVAYELIRRLIHGAAEYDTDIMVTLCPMCQLNLDAYQVEMNKFFNTNYHVPVLYFTQLIGLAFGMSPQDLGLGKEFVDARSALAKIGVEIPVEEPAEPRRRPKKEEGLPMPRMKESK